MTTSRKKNTVAIVWTVAVLASLVLVAVMAAVAGLAGDEDDGEGVSALASSIPDTPPSFPAESDDSDDAGEGYDWYESDPTYADPTQEAEEAVEDIVTDDEIADTALLMAIADAPGESATWDEDQVRSQAELVCDLRNETPDQDLSLALMMLVDSGAEGLELEDQSYFYGVAWVWCEETGR